MVRFAMPFQPRLAVVAVASVVGWSVQGDAGATPAALPNPLLQKAQRFLDLRQNDAALACLNELIKLEPRNAKAYLKRSLVYSLKEMSDDALKDCNKAISLNPKLAEARGRRAQVYVEQNRLREALVESNRAISLAPKSALGYSIRAWVYDCQSKYELEVADCTRAIELQPKRPKNYVLRAMAWSNLSRFKEALQDCNTAISLKSTEAKAYSVRGFIYSRLAKLDQAITDFSTSINFVPWYRDYEMRANAYAELGQFQKQIDDLTSAIRLNPKDLDLYRMRGAANLNLWHLQNAIRDATKALNAKDSSEKWGFNLSTVALAYEALNQYDKAIEVRTKLVERFPKNAFHLAKRARNYEAIGKFELARADRKRAAALASPKDLMYMQLDDPLIDFKNISCETLKIRLAKQLKGNSVILPFKYDVHGGGLFVPVGINGKELQFMVDTGCSQTQLLKRDLAGVAQVEKLELEGTMASGKKYSYSFFRAQTFQLGGLNFSNVAISVDEHTTGEPTHSGLLGGNIFECFVVTVDYEKQQLTLSNACERASDQAIIAPMRIRNHIPFLDVKLNGTLDVVAGLDTGAASGFAPDSILRPILNENLTFPNHMLGPWLGDVHSATVPLKSIGIGASTVAGPKSDVIPAHEAARLADSVVLGNDFLSRFRTVTFDYPGRRVILEPR